MNEKEETMSSQKCSQILVKCPFYCRDDGKKSLTCEGIVEDSSITWKFQKRENFKQQLHVFCCEYYKNCEIYRMLMENKYE